MDAAESFDLNQLDFSRPVAGIEEIRAILPHRFEMEMLTGIVLIDPAKQLIVGYKDFSTDEFWARGHMPGFPLLPGVLMCEAAAQLCCFYNIMQKVNSTETLMGLGGIEETRFLRPVRPGSRLIIVGHGLRVHRRLTRFHAIGHVDAEKVFETTVIGVPIGKWEDLKGA
ncbi:MAG TPA: 3-hydroxyacyl-ACP dehydratase FabZ family protein [Urbifossiella sp.]|nr:3-hydroxyacyl-ACP dehydratase FabZ family protein [Urbifossiella sp.]